MKLKNNISMFAVLTLVLSLSFVMGQVPVYAAVAVVTQCTEKEQTLDIPDDESCADIFDDVVDIGIRSGCKEVKNVRVVNEIPWPDDSGGVLGGMGGMGGDLGGGRTVCYFKYDCCKDVTLMSGKFEKNS